jgi:DNA polymerase III alpha subunit
MKVLPLFTSAYSFRSILTLDKGSDEGGADSIIKICKDEGIKNLYLIEDNMVGFLEAKKYAGKAVNLRFGLRLTFCSDITQKTDESEKTESKYVIFACSPVGYTLLTQIFTAANVEGFHHKPMC